MEASIAKILNNVNTSEIYGSNDRSVEGLVIDSRLASPGTMFIATRGTVTDGHNFIENAVEKGAVAVVCEDFPSEISENVIYIKVKDSSFALGLIASNFYDNPSKKLKLIGITGTNGKTTTATLLYNLTRKLGYRAGLISTVKYYINEKEVDSTHTTPDSISLNMLMKQMVDDHCDYCFMEVSSHAIAQERISGLHFEGGVFTNITHDHLDYHKTFENYIKTKKKFFDILPDTSFSLVNDDDKNGRIMIQNTASRKFTYSIHSASDFKCRIHESNFDGMLLNLEGKELWTKLIGKFNAYNILAVYSVASLLGFPKEEIPIALSGLSSVAGRFQYVKSADGIVAIIDYAHTPDALLNVLNTINEIKSSTAKLTTVVGAGGNRDKTKRPIMARIAADLSNTLILTSDNPRFEKPEDILRDMELGIEKGMDKRVLTIIDRKEAIKTACLMAGKGDIVLIAGKGHENYQEIEGVKHHFDDKEIVQDLFNKN